MDKLDLYTSIVPTTAQKIAQRHTFNVFIHYGMNTFTGKEWGTGKESAQLFNPSEQDTDQWLRCIAASGASGVILTCKHHDGFCLWPTETTAHSVKHSPYKDGKGDVVREVSDSCRKYGLRFGVYLSPWDRNHSTYGSEAYNDVYCRQLTELLTNYGEIFCVWLDGACGSYMDNKPKQHYDFDRIYALVRELAPNAVISNCGPDIRWVGNEGGIARKSEWNVVPAFACDTQSIAEHSQHADGEDMVKNSSDIVASDLGSRKFLAGYDEFMWYPAEVDVSIRPGWFYHKAQDAMVRSLDNLLKIYYTSVGGNSFLLLNVPPDKCGLICEQDAETLRRLGAHLAKSRDQIVDVVSVSAPQAAEGCGCDNLLEYSYSGETGDPLAYYMPEREAQSYTLTFQLDKPHSINQVQLIENTAFSQRIEAFSVYVYQNGHRKKVYDGTTVGFGRIAVFAHAVETDRVEIVLTSVRKRPVLEFVGIYRDNGYRMKKSFLEPLKLWLHQKNYELYVARENKKRKAK